MHLRTSGDRFSAGSGARNPTSMSSSDVESPAATDAQDEMR